MVGRTNKDLFLLSDFLSCSGLAASLITPLFFGTISSLDIDTSESFRLSSKDTLRGGAQRSCSLGGKLDWQASRPQFLFTCLYRRFDFGMATREIYEYMKNLAVERNI